MTPDAGRTTGVSGVKTGGWAEGAGSGAATGRHGMLLSQKPARSLCAASLAGLAQGALDQFETAGRVGDGARQPQPGHVVVRVQLERLNQQIAPTREVVLLADGDHA